MFRSGRAERGVRIMAVTAFLSIAALATAVAQDSPGPTASPTPTPLPSATISPARNVRLSFVPPPMDGTISFGIFDVNRKLVRVLHREAAVKDFTIAADALVTTWDGKNDAGEDLPPGRYRARGYLVAHFKIEDLGKTATPPGNDGLDHVAVKLVTNPLVSDTRSVVDLGVGFDDKGSFLKTMDGLPLCTVSKTPNLIRALITKSGEKSVDVWEDDGTAVEQLRISNIDKMMAFDCGHFELK